MGELIIAAVEAELLRSGFQRTEGRPWVQGDTFKGHGRILVLCADGWYAGDDWMPVTGPYHFIKAASLVLRTVRYNRPNEVARRERKRKLEERRARRRLREAHVRYQEWQARQAAIPPAPAIGRRPWWECEPWEVTP